MKRVCLSLALAVLFLPSRADECKTPHYDSRYIFTGKVLTADELEIENYAKKRVHEIIDLQWRVDELERRLARLEKLTQKP